MQIPNAYEDFMNRHGVFSPPQNNFGNDIYAQPYGNRQSYRRW
jgi:hypothetical protein